MTSNQQMTDEFDVATSAAQFCARGLVSSGADSATIANALIVQGLSVWAAGNGRLADAEEFLKAWFNLAGEA